MLNTVNAMSSNWWIAIINEKKYGGFDLADIIIAFSLAVLATLWFRRVAKRSRETTRLPPGPRGLPLIGYLPFLGTDLHREFANLASVYGPIFKFWLGNKLCVVITSPSLVKEVVRDQDTTFANRDSTVSGLIASYGAHDIAFASYGPDWKKMRKIFVREMLNNTVLDNLYGLRRDEVKKSVRHIYEKINTKVDMGSLAFLTAINAIMSMSCGASIQGESAVIDAADFKKAAAELMRLLGKPNVSDIFPSLARFDIQGIERDTKKVNRVFEEMFDSAIEKRKKMVAAARVKGGENNGNEMRKDFLQFLLELHENGERETSLSSAELKAMITDTVLGATDTTATTVEWLMAELLSHPEAMNNVYKELNEVVGPNNNVEEFHLSKLTYMNAVIKETLRLHPPLPFLLPRFPSKSTTIGGYSIPKGTKIFLNVWAIQRDPSVWENPNEFIPERFLSGEGSQVQFSSGNNFGFIPFGYGRRICAGVPLAERIVIYILATFLHLFEWKLPPGEKLDLSDKFGIVVKKRDTLIAIPMPRFSNPEIYA